MVLQLAKLARWLEKKQSLPNPLGHWRLTCDHLVDHNEEW